MPAPEVEDLENELRVGEEESSTAPAFEETMEPGGIGDDEDGNKDMKTGRKRPRKGETYAAIRKQIEFYFSDANITKDRMMKEIVLGSEYVKLDTFLKFNKVASISKDVKEIQRALRKSEKLELSQDEESVKRKIPFDEATAKSTQEVENCTIYVENIPKHANHDWIEKVFQEFCTIAYISLPKYKNGHPKGFAFVEFEEEEGAVRCLQAFGEAGACLPSSVDPSGLTSINTYNPENVMKVEVDKSELQEAMVSSEESKDPAVPQSKSRRKRLNSKSIDQPDGDRSSKKPKLVEEEQVEGIEESAKVETKNETSPDQNVDTIADSSDISKKKKRKKRKRRSASGKLKEEEKLESESIQLRILPKRHWRQLRNRYLNLQRENMAALKRQMRFHDVMQSEEGYGQTPGPQTYRPGTKYSTSTIPPPSVCVKIELESPAKTVETFKAEIQVKVVPLGVNDFIKFVDYTEGSVDAIVRLSPYEEHIKKFIDNANTVFKKATRLSVQEATDYWKTVKLDQARKKKAAKENKIRGKDKLLKRAEKLENHIRFSDDTAAEEGDEMKTTEEPDIQVETRKRKQGNSEDSEVEAIKKPCT